MKISSPAFENEGKIPRQYTCEGENISPPLMIEDVPEGTASLALIMEDPDVPKQLMPSGLFTHWILFNIPPDTREIPESGSIGLEGTITSGKTAYTGPCPPAEHMPNEHRYIFRLWALNAMLPLAEGASREELEPLLTEHEVGYVEYQGRYRKEGTSES